MPSLTVLNTTAVPDRVRGALSRWMIETNPGLYVGTLSARVRDELWRSVSESVGRGAAVLVYPDANEQGFTLRTAGERRRTPVDFDGLTLIALRPDESTVNAGMPVLLTGATDRTVDPEA
ncbi:type I-E CRISPR-associated endoribonuclease Cas2e [Streptomyces sp. NPDC004673]